MLKSTNYHNLFKIKDVYLLDLVVDYQLCTASIMYSSRWARGGVLNRPPICVHDCFGSSDGEKVLCMVAERRFRDRSHGGGGYPTSGEGH